MNLPYSEAVERMHKIHGEMVLLAHSGDPDAESRAAQLHNEFCELDEHVTRLQRTSALANAAGNGGRFQLERGSAGDDYDVDPLQDPSSAANYRGRNPWDLSEVRAFGRKAGEVSTELRARALSAIEKMPGANDKVRAAATDILERFDSADSKLALLCLITSSPAYMRAWAKAARGQLQMLEPDEIRALNQADEYRAMSLTDSQGGYLVPFQLDPTVILTSDGTRNDIRQIARKVVATGDVWHGVSAAAVQWSWDAEASEVSDDSPPFAQPSIPVYTARGFVPISIEALQDEQNVTTEVAKLLAQGKDILEAQAFALGTGSGQPTGIITALTGTASVYPAATNDTFALKDVYGLQGALPARYRANASWLANNLWYNLLRQFDTAGGAGMWAQVGQDRPLQLLARDVYEAEAMDGTIDTGQHNYMAIFADFDNYVIADRIGMLVEFIPHLFNTANNRPTGQRGWFAYYRTGAGSVNNGAFRMLDV